MENPSPLTHIIVHNAHEHNLKNINLSLPKNKLVVITGVRGSGKSTLAFDTIYAEGQRKYIESLSAYARQFLAMMDKPKVDKIEGLSPAISIDQKTTSKNPRSTVGTVPENWKEMDEDGHRKAPPLNGTGHTWHHDDQTLHSIIKYGLAKLVKNYQGKMIGFEDNLTDKEIDSVLAYIKSFWPKEEYEYQINLSK